MNRDEKQQVVILGAGFAGLYTALGLAKALRGQPVEITLVDRHNYFLFTPLLHEVAAGLLDMRHVVRPVRQIIRGTGITFREEKVEGIDLEARRVETGGGSLSYDYLVLALGSETNYYGNGEIQRHAFPFKTLGDALRLRNHLIDAFEVANTADDPVRRRRLLTFVVAGGGCTGIELISEIHDLVHHVLVHDYPDINFATDVRLVMAEALDRVLCPMDMDLARRVLKRLRGKQIEVRLDTPVTGAGEGWVELGGDQQIETDTLIWAAGVKPNSLVAALPLDKDGKGRIIVDRHLAVPGHPEIHALGDNASAQHSDGTPLPETAQVAVQQADTVAHNLAAAWQGKPQREFRYQHRGDLVSLGRRAGVSDAYGLKLHGFPAWFLWRTVYLGKLPGWGNRVRVALDWALDLIFSRDTSRIEVEQPTRGG